MNSLSYKFIVLNLQVFALNLTHLEPIAQVLSLDLVNVLDLCKLALNECLLAVFELIKMLVQVAEFLFGKLMVFQL